MDKKLYNKDSIESLSPLEFTRLRPGVYAGDTTYSTQLLVEIVSNAVDEFRLGHGNKIIVKIDKDIVTVIDSGQGFLVNEKRDDGKTVLEMRELAKDVPVAEDVLKYAMNLVANTHPELKETSEVAKKYIKYGASPRAGQALITAAKIRALINGNYNVSYEDILRFKELNILKRRKQNEKATMARNNFADRLRACVLVV